MNKASKLSKAQAKNPLKITSGSILEFKRSLKRAGKLTATVECYGCDVSHFLRWLLQNHKRSWIYGVEDITYYLYALAAEQHCSVNSSRRKLISLKVFLRYLASLQDPPQNSPAEDVPLPQRDESLPDLLGTEDIELLLKLSAQTPRWYKAIRDPALIALLGFEGLKSHEIIHLKQADLLQHSSSSNQSSLTLTISAPRSRSLVLSEPTCTYLRQYLKELRIHEEHTAKPLPPPHLRPMFTGLQGRSGVFNHTPMSRHGIKFMLYELGKKAELQRLNTEQLRHHAVDYHLQAGKSPDELKAHLGLRTEGNILKHIHHRQRQSLL